MSTDTKEIKYRTDETLRSPEKEDYTQIGLVQRLQQNPAGGILVWNVLYLSFSDSGNTSASEIDEVIFLRLLCRGEKPQKVQAQIKSSSDENIVAWCDYIRTNNIWLAVIPAEKPTDPPWNVYGVPIEMGSFKFEEDIKPKSNEGRSLDYIFTASEGEIPRSAFGSILGFFSRQK